MQPETLISPSLQVLFLQLCNLTVQNISNSAPAPGLGDVCVSNRAELKAVRTTMEELFNEIGEQSKKIQQLDSTIENKFLEFTQNSNSALGKRFKELEDQTAAQYQMFNVCNEIRKENEHQKEELTVSLEQERKLRLQMEEEYHLYKDAVKQLVKNTSGAADILLNASKAGNTAFVKVLVDVGVYVDVRDGDGFTALHWAARKGHPDTVQFLVDAGAKIDAKTLFDDTALHWAANNGNIDTCRVLLAAGANVQETSSKGFTPLHIAAIWGYSVVCQLFLDSGANIDALDNDKETALHKAAAMDNADVVRLLLASGANRILKNSSGKTPLDIARDKGYTQVVMALSTA